MMIIDIFKEIICKVEKEYDSNVNYIHGHIDDIVAELRAYKTQQGEAKKYPLIALLQPFNEPTSERYDISKEVELNILICSLSKMDAKPSIRYEKNFKTTIITLEELLIKYIKKSGYFELNYQEPSYTSIDDWGENRELSDYIDVRKLNNMKLKLRKNICN